LWSRLRWSMYNLRHIDPLCMFRGYVILIENLSHRSTVYSGGCAIWWRHGSTVYDWWPWPWFMMSSVYDLSMGMPTSELIHMILCWCLDVCRSPIRCAFGFWHTHTAYKVYRLSLVPLSDFGGHSVIHNFDHRDDVMMMLWWWKIKLFTKNTFLRKSYICFLPEIMLLKDVRRLPIYLPARMPDSRRLH